MTAADAPGGGGTLDRLRALYRWATQLRLLAFSLVALGAVGAVVLGAAAVAVQLLVIPATAAGVDLGVSFSRLRKVSFPWAGLVTGMFVALLLPPQGVPGPGVSSTWLFAGAAMAALAILLRHLLRSRGHPWFNPAALAVLLLGLLFGITPAWWGAVSLPAFLVAGFAVNLRAWRRWPLPASFFATYSALVILHRVLYLHLTSTPLLLLSVLDPAVMFFTLLMVTEPRSAPSDPMLLPVYGSLAGLVAVLAGFLIPGASPIVTADSLLLGLIVANLAGVALRAVGTRSPTVAPEERRRRPKRSIRPAAAPKRWAWSERAAVGFAALVLLVVAVSLVPAPVAPSGAPPRVTVLSCTQDNQSLPASEVQMLHNRLGPSVIFSYDSATGTTVFYDPVNHVTVYETDLFEDFGSAEFNGDDAIISQGCSVSGSPGSGGALG